jgi:hypothetical protein
MSTHSNHIDNFFQVGMFLKESTIRESRQNLITGLKYQSQLEGEGTCSNSGSEGKTMANKSVVRRNVGSGDL